MSALEVLFTPADFAALVSRDLSGTACVVFDVLRATSSMVTALANGAAAIVPVEQIQEALELRLADSTLLLGGERDGVRITADLTGGIDFDLGNSPREFTTAAISGRTIVMTTTNGTRALRACSRADSVLAGSFLNLGSTVGFIRHRCPAKLLLVCSGTFEQAAYEDVLAAGAFCDATWPLYARSEVADSALIARGLYRLEQGNLLGAVSQARNARRLLGRAALRDDVAYCLQRDLLDVVAELKSDGHVQRA